MRLPNLKCLIGLIIFNIFLSAGVILAQVPVISSISPASGQVASQITITGSNFNTTPYMNIVSFGASRANIISATATTLVVQVPWCTTYEPISVLNLSTRLTGYYPFPFRRVSPYTRSSISAGDLDARVDIATGEKPNRVILCDMDGNGLTDIVVSNATGNTLSVYRNTATYGNIASTMFNNRVDLAANGNPTSIAVMDMNGDGLPDIATTNASGNTLSVFRNTSTAGNIQFAARMDLAAGNTPFALSIGDLDNDGRPDIAVANLKDNTVSVFNNTGTAGNMAFATKTDIATGLSPNALKLGDIDGDGKAELVVANLKDNNFSVFKNTSAAGAITFAAKVDFATGQQPTFVDVADVNQDGKLDVLVTNYGPGDHNISIFRNLSTGAGISSSTFAARVNFDVGSEPTCISIGDIDADGKEDITVTNFNSNTLSVLRNISTTGNVAFMTKVDFATGFAPESLAIGDMDGDGSVDIVAANNFQHTLSVLRYYMPYTSHPVMAESTSSVSVGSFVNVDLLDNEWKMEAPKWDNINPPITPAYSIAPDNGSMINPSLDAPINAGRFVYFYAMGSRATMTRVDGHLTFTATGSGYIEVRMIASYNGGIGASHLFELINDGQPHDYSWDFVGLYPELEYHLAVIFNNGNVQGKAQFKKNFCLVLRQAGMAGNFVRYRADQSSLIGNSETEWKGLNSYGQLRKKYLQHSAYARMKFNTDATRMAVEYVREISDKPAVNLFPTLTIHNAMDFDASGNMVAGTGIINDGTLVEGLKTYTITGLKTTNPRLVWFTTTQSGKVPLAGPTSLGTNYGTAADPMYVVTAPANATHMALLVYRYGSNESFDTFGYCMVQKGAPGDLTQQGVVPLPFSSYSGTIDALISGLTVYVNDKLFKYYQLDGNDLQRQVQFIVDELPPGMKTIEIVSCGQGGVGDYSPTVKRSGTFLRAVYFPAANTTILPSSTKAPGSIVYIHDSILSGYNISSNPQNNVWMMKIKRDPNYGFTGDVFSEGYAGRILHADTQTPAGLAAFAQKLNSFGVNKYWFQIGVNDFSFKTPLHKFYSEFKELIELLHQLNNNVHIYIQATGPQRFEGRNSETFEDDKTTASGPYENDFRDVQRALGTAYPYCEFVDFEGLFPNSYDYLSDGIHPTDAGNTAYTNGIRDKSSLLGNPLPLQPLGFNRAGTDILSFTQNTPGISIIRVKGGRPPYTYTINYTNATPGQLTFDKGVFSGTPSTAGTFEVNVTVQDATAATTSGKFNVIVKPVPTVYIYRQKIPGAQVGVPYSQTFLGKFGTGPYTFSIDPGTLASANLTFNPSTGTLAGTPPAAAAGNTFTFTITATDYYGRSGSKSYNLPVTTAAPPAMTDQVIVEYMIDGNNDVYLRAKVSDFYNSEIQVSPGISVEQQNNTVTFLPVSGSVAVKVGPNRLVGEKVFIGHINSAYGAVKSVTVYPGTLVFPASSDNVTFTAVAGQTF